MVVANTRTKSIQKQIKSIDVDKVGGKKPLASIIIMFLVELIASSFLDLISKQARPECRCKRVLVVMEERKSTNCNTPKKNLLAILRQENQRKVFTVTCVGANLKNGI